MQAEALLDELGELVGPARLRAPLAITGVNVVTMSTPGVTPEQNVVVEAGRISSVGDGPIPRGARELDGRGRWLMPGLADMHTHVSDAGALPLYLANGVTRVRNMWGGPAHLRLQARMRRGELPGPLIFTTGPITDGGPTYPGVDIVSEPAQAAATVEAQQAAGYQALKVYSFLRPDCCTALCQAAHERGWKVYGHCPNEMTVAAAVEAGMDSLEHLIHLPALLEAEGADSVRRVGALLAERDVWSCPTLSVIARIGAGPGQLESPAFRCMPRAAVEQWLSRTGADRWTPQRAEQTATSIERLQTVVALLHAEGAPLIFGTDSGSPMTVPGFTIGEELELMAGAGLSAHDVLRTATVDAARSLGIGSTAGQVAPGFEAELILLDANPLDDLGALSRISHVVSNGFLFDRASLDRLVEWRAATADASLQLPLEELGPMATPTWWARR